MTARNSHLAALGLVRNPFPYTPDAGCYFSTPHLEEQMVELAHCIQARKGFSLLTAEVGMGKSTLVRRLMTDLAAKQVVSALVFNTFLQGPELLAAVLQDFGLPSSGTMSADIAELNAFLLKNHVEGKTCLLIIDDAQNLSESSLELVRLLCNLETDQEKLLQILLAGQPELEETLSQHNLRQLRSRVVKHARLHQLNSTEIADYIKFRLESAGNDGAVLLQADACQRLWKESQGVPRHIHLIMDRCLYGLAGRHGNVIDVGLMNQAIDDCKVDLTGPVMEQATPAEPAARTGRIGLALAGLVGIAVLGAGAWMTVGTSDATARIRQAIEPVKASMAQPDPGNEVLPKVSPAHVEDGAPRDPAAPGTAVAQTDSGQTGTLVAAAPKTATGSPAANPDPCLIYKGVEADHMVISQPLNEVTHRLMGSRLARLGDACLDSRQGQHWLTWSTPQSGYDLKKRLTAARFQIALTQYGSLLSSEVDGVWGDNSRGALMQFQTALGLAPTGTVDALSGLLLERFYAKEQ
jgi:general secretion pathway protein A